jgi:CubicO group peptidase (beta-lactamase class C family)
VAVQAPIAPPATGARYHALTFGWICGELVRRIDGRSTGRFLRAEVGEPLGLDLWLGLAECHERPPRADFGSEQRQLALEGDPVAWSIWSNPPRFRENDLAANLRAWHAAEIPATSGIVTARSLSRLYGCLARGGVIDGARLLSAKAIDLVRRPLASGIDGGMPVAFGAGF